MTLGGPGRGGWVGGPALSPLPSLTSCRPSLSPPPAGCSIPPPHCRCPDRQSGRGSLSPCCRERARGYPGAQGCQGAPTHPALRTPFPSPEQSRCRHTEAAGYPGKEVTSVSGRQRKEPGEVGTSIPKPQMEVGRRASQESRDFLWGQRK